MSGPIWITEKDVVGLMSLPEAIEALRAGLVEEAAGTATNMVKTHVVWDKSATLHAIGAVFEGRRLAGTKTWAHTAGGAMPLLIVIDADNGAVVAIIEAFALGQMRTGGISGLGTDVLARPDASVMAMIGAGKQSLAQVAAVAAVRDIKDVRVWSPTEAKRTALAQKIEAELGLRSDAVGSVEEAVGDADVVTLATRATAPFLTSAMLRPGTHLNAVGAITPERSEFEPAMLDRAAVMAADSVNQVRRLSREFMQAFGEDDAAWERLQPLSRLVAADAKRPDEADLTVFKAMGMGISDLALGAALVEQAAAAGLGREIERPVRVAPRLTRTKSLENA